MSNGWQPGFLRTSNAAQQLLAADDPEFQGIMVDSVGPVAIRGGSSDGKKVLFSIWETRVRDYTACAKATGSAAKPSPPAPAKLNCS